MVKHANIGVMLRACSDVTMLGIGSTQEADSSRAWLLPLRLGIPLPHAAESRGKDELFKPMSVTDP